MKIEPCPFCGGAGISGDKIKPKVGDVEEQHFVMVGCSVCGFGQMEPYTGDFETAVKKYITKWNTRVYPEDKIIDLKLKKLSLREKTIDVKRKSVDLEEVKKASAGRTLEQVKAINNLLSSVFFETEMNASNTESIIKVTKAYSDLDIELFKNKMRLLLDRI